jgi:bifunctional non-homologous end joining protein LigD
VPLEDYARKRSFSKTPEPPPKPLAAQAGRRFCVQRHLARRLHYDFRLEIGGVLKSWAVPQGPTLDPAVKRLAVLVEDHPLEYGEFEGNIPPGNYGAGSVMLWDRGTYELLGEGGVEEQFARGDLKFRLNGTKLKGAFALVRMKGRGKGNEWLLIKKKDEAAQAGWDPEAFAWSVLTGRMQEEIARELPARTRTDPAPQRPTSASVPGAVRAEMPREVTPMLAVAAEKPPAEPGWLYEIKWDGVRALCFLGPEGLRIVSRKGTPIDRQYPELAVLPHYVEARAAILDGEIVALDEQGRPSFERLQPRIMASEPAAVAHLARTRPVTLYVFDLLYLDGYDLRSAPLADRKRLLASILRPGPVVRLSEHFEAGGAELLDAVRANDLEGIVAKRAASPYAAGRSADWLKIKTSSEQEFVICGFTEGRRDYFGALVLGIYQNGELQFAGSVGTGFDRKTMEGIARSLEALRREVCPFRAAPPLPQSVTWVRPELVCTVRFHSWTEEGRLRAPVFVGVRPDVEPGECVRRPTQIPGRRGRNLLLAPGRAEAVVEADGRRIRLRNLTKVFYPREGYTKADVIRYYDAVAELLAPHLKDRPLALRRYPDGIEAPHFFQKDAPRGLPEWMRTEVIEEEDAGKPKRYVIGADRATLLYLANLGCIDQNPWMSRIGSLDHPDWILIDLDAQECGFDRIVEAALLVRRKLEQVGLAGYPKTTGGDGMHIYVPLEPVYRYEQTRALAEILARLLAAERPDLFTVPRAVAAREKGKVYFDYLQNARGKTISAPYVLRPYPGAPVATPLEWSEVAPGLSPAQFHIRNALERFERRGDLFEGVLRKPQRLEAAMEKLDQMIREAR